MATPGRRTLRLPKPAIVPRAVARPPLSCLAHCVADASLAIRDREAGPADPNQFDELMTRLAGARTRRAPIYQQGVFDPFVAALTALGETEFTRVLASDLNNDRAGRLMMDIAQALLQPAEGVQSESLRAFQEKLSDLYDGF